MYEIFISFKNMDNGQLTEDFYIANKLYKLFMKAGYNVFMSSNSLKTVGESDYKNGIDSALDCAKILIAVATKTEYIESKWVRYEWDSFFNDIISGFKKDGKVFTVTQGISTAELPRTLRQTQVFNIAGEFEETAEQLLTFIVNALGRKTEPAPITETKKNYSIIGYDEIINNGWDFCKIVNKLIDIIHLTLEEIAEPMMINSEPSAKIMERSIDTWRILVDSENNPVGHWFFIALYDNEFEKAKKGELLEEEINYKNINYVTMPGEYKGYFLQIELLKEYRNISTFQMLVKSFLSQVEYLAKNEVFFSEWCANATSPEGESMAKSLGMSCVANNKLEGKIYHSNFLPSEKIPLLKRFPKLIEAYREYYAQKTENL